MFRDPRIVKMAPRGDMTEYLCVMESDDHKIYAAVARFTRLDEMASREESVIVADTIEHAWHAVRRMVELDRPVPEASLADNIHDHALAVMLEVGESPDVIIPTGATGA